MRSRHIKIRVALVSSCLNLICASSIQAQTASANADIAENWFQAAREASAIGDFPVAVANLERILLDNPNLANIKLELGLLYLRLGQADLARAYLEAAAAAPDAPESARVRAREALRQANLNLRRFSASGVIQIGTQYQSNPNGSPGSVSVVGPGGLPVILQSDQLSVTRGGDVSSSISGSAELRHGLGGQRGTDLVANLTSSYTRYAKQDQINTLYLGGQVGPRFLLGPAFAARGFLRPYGEIVYLGLGDAHYFTAYGGGMALIWQLTPTLQYSGQIGYNRREYKNSRARPSSTDQTGSYVSGLADFIWQANPKTLIDVGVIGERGSARRGFWSRNTYGASLAIVRNLSLGSLGAIARLSLGWRHSRYDDPDALVDPNVRRRENRYDLAGGLGIPLNQRLTLDLSAQRQWNPSSLPNYDYRNSVGSVSLSYRY